MSPVSLLSFEQRHSPTPGEPQSASLLDGHSSLISDLRARLRQIAPFFRAALVHGEAGAGKHRTACELHRLCCADGPFVRIDGSALRGSASRESGNDPLWAELLRAAQGGVLFLDEVGEAPLHVQSSLVEHLHSPHWRGTAERDRAKVVASTCSDPRLLVAAGRLHRQLHGVLSAVTIRVPSLRERTEDIADLCGVLLREEFETASDLLPLSPACLNRLQSCARHGNITELRSTLRRLSQAGFEEAPTEPDSPLRTGEEPAAEETSGPMRLQELINTHVSKVLAICGGNKLKTAETLGVSRSTLYRMLDEMAGAASGSLRP